MNKAIRESYELRVEAALAAARHAAAINHPGLEGEVREILVRELLRPILPPTFAFGTGKIVDHQGNQSDEIDVVVYDRAVMPPLLFSDMTLLGLFPVEACRYAIEVKSTATSATWKKASANALSTDRLTYLPPIDPDPRWKPVLPMFFAFRTSHKSDPSKQLELVRWKKLNKKVTLPEHGLVDVSTFAAVCVAGQGYGYWRDAPLLDRHWTAATAQHDEVITWFMGVSNTLFESVGRPPSRFGNYLD